MLDDSRLYLCSRNVHPTRYDRVVREGHGVLCFDTYAVLRQHYSDLQTDGRTDELSGAWKSFAVDKDVVERSELYCFFWCAYNIGAC